MTPRRVAALAAVLLLATVAVAPRAQLKVLPEQGGRIGLGLMLRRLSTTGILMESTAHPDDENSGLHALLNLGKGYHTTLATATRGTGGQNEIGPELFESLAVLRTEELAAVHRWDGAEQFFARAIDFGYSFSIEETFDKWGKDQILDDYVRLIRMIRPDVVVTMRPEGEGGGQHHQATGVITAEAFRAAGDPARFSGQVKEGLRPWQPRKLYYSLFGSGAGGAGARAVVFDSDVYDTLLGQTYAEIGSLARSNHKCQGMGQLLSLPGPAVRQYRLADTTIAGQAEKTEASLFDGIDTSIPGLARFGAGLAPEPLRSALAEINRQVGLAQRAFDTQGPAATVPPLVAGLSAVRNLLRQIGGLGLDEGAAYEIGVRLAQKAREFQRALVLAQGVRLDVVADDGVLVRGQPVGITLIAANRGASPMEVRQLTLSGFEGGGGCKAATIAPGGLHRCEAVVQVPADARLTAPYWAPRSDAARYDNEPGAPFGAPFLPTPFQATFELAIGGAEVSVDAPVQYRDEGSIFSGEKRMELHVVPRFSVRPAADITIVPAAAARDPKGGRELRVTVTSGAPGASSGTVALRTPAGWRVTPASAQVAFAREDESRTVRFSFTPPSDVRPGSYPVHAVVTGEAETSELGYEVIEYPHINRRHRIIPAVIAVKVVDVGIPAGLRVGYIKGVGDEVPFAIQQLGASLDLLDADQLAWGDLATYDAIVTGVRAYERRADLRANNQRLIEYAREGGTLIVQYNKFEFNEAQYAPLAAKVSGTRVTDENAPVEILVPGHPLFTFPNRIDEATWRGWVQERGLYFLGDRDPAYVDLVQMADPFPFNPGPKRGALVEAAVGKGRWIYVGLGLWRQLPAGTDGAYALLANLISLGRAGVNPAAAKPK